jgi:hypothetical protein
MYEQYDGEDNSPYNVIFEAPDFASLMKHKSSSTAKDYTDRVRSMVKAGVIAGIKTGNFADAAALLDHGDAFARATGDIADVSDTARKYLDILTAPDSPWLAFAMTSAMLFSQVARNHSEGIKTAAVTRKDKKRARKAAIAEGTMPEGAVTWKVPLIKKHVTLRFKISPKAILTRVAMVFQGSTYSPQELAFRVFSDEALIKTLASQGIIIKHDTDE